MKTLLFAVGQEALETYLVNQLKETFQSVGAVVYREAILKEVRATKPDCLLLRESLSGKENVLEIIYQLKKEFPTLRIIFLTGNRTPGDKLLATLVNYNIYDILYGTRISADEILQVILNPKTHADVIHLQPVPVFDETKDEVAFVAPPPQVIERMVRVEEHIQGEESLVVIQSPNKETKEKKSGNVWERWLPPNTKAHYTIQTSGSRVFAFMGGKNGVGTSTIAINTAMLQAKKGIKTIYIEWNDTTPYVPYLFDMGHFNKGIETALFSLEQGNIDPLQSMIVKYEDLIKDKENPMYKNYKEFPPMLDYLFFSTEYVFLDSELKQKLPVEQIKSLVLYLLFQAQYECIILDLAPKIDPYIKEWLRVAYHVFTVVTPEVSSIGYAIRWQDEYQKEVFQLAERSTYIINQFQKNRLLSLEDIKKWVNQETVIPIPPFETDIVEAHYIGRPLVFYNKKHQKPFHRVLQQMEQ